VTPDEIKAEYLKCKGDYWYYLKTYWKTMDKNTGLVKPFATFDNKYDKPEYEDFIHWFLNEVHKRVIAKRQIEKPDIADEKFRQAYMTNSIAALTGYYLSFADNFRGLFTHEKEEKMDSPGDFNTPFGMIDFGMTHLPDWLTPRKDDLTRSHMKIGLKCRNSLLTGDAGDRPGAGGGYDLIYNTEFAHQKNTFAKLAAEIEAAKGPIILDSTPNGSFNAHALTCAFAEKTPEKSSYLFVPIDWYQRRTQEWLELKVKDYNGDDALMAQEIYRSRTGSIKGRAFSHFNIEHITTIDAEKFKPFLSINGFDFGWIHATACVFIAPLDNDRWVVYDEYVDREKPTHIHAEKVCETIRRWGVTNTHWIADPSGISKSREIGKSFYELYKAVDIPVENRIAFEEGDNAIKEGITQVNTMFYKSKLLVSSRCVRLIDALNEAKYPVNKRNEPTSEKYEESQFSDILDALRYGVSKLGKYQKLVESRQLNVTYRQPKPQGLGMGIYGGGK
jgi:hypothetical protein